MTIGMNKANKGALQEEVESRVENVRESGASIAFKEAQVEAELSDDSGSSVYRFTKLLRVMGAAVLVAAAATFLIQSRGPMTSVERYYSFLAFAVVVSISGFFCGLKLRDDKAARTLLGIATGFLPVLFAKMGALAYSLTHPALGDMSEMLIYKIDSPSDFIFLGLISSAVLVPISYLGFSVLTRPVAKLTTAVFFVVNAVLLLPTRDADIVSIIGLVLVSVVAIIDYRYLSPHSVMKTWEGFISRFLLYVPAGILVGRNMLLYNTSALMLSLVALAVGIEMFFVIPRCFKNNALRKLSQHFSLVPVAFSWFVFHSGVLLDGRMESYVSFFRMNEGGPFRVSFSLPLAVIVFAMSFFSISGATRYRKWAARFAVLSVIVQLIVVGGVVSSLICILTAVIVTASAFVMQERGLLYSGVSCLALGLLYHIRFASELFSMSPWFVLAVSGVGVVILSSYIEQHYVRIISSSKRFASFVNSWTEAA